MRLAVIPVYTQADSRFGMNHAFGWPEMLRSAGRAGWCWMRDWSLKWQDVEPEKGQFTFAETDAQIDRSFGKTSSARACWRSRRPCGRRRAGQRAAEQPVVSDLLRAPDPETQHDEILAEPGRRIAPGLYAPRHEGVPELRQPDGGPLQGPHPRLAGVQRTAATGYALPRTPATRRPITSSYIEAFAEAARASRSQVPDPGRFQLCGHAGATGRAAGSSSSWAG